MEIKGFRLIEYSSGVNYLGTCFTGSATSKKIEMEPCGIGSIYIPPDCERGNDPAYIYHGEILAHKPNGIGLVASLSQKTIPLE
jgi:hypothetical protein